MTVSVVERFEMVDVKHHEGQRPFVTHTAFAFGVEVFLEAASIEKPRQHVHLSPLLGKLMKTGGFDGSRCVHGEHFDDLNRLIRGHLRFRGPGLEHTYHARSYAERD